MGSLTPTPYYHQQCLVLLLILIDKCRKHIRFWSEDGVSESDGDRDGKDLKTIGMEVIGRLEQSF